MAASAEPEYAVNWQSQISEVITRLGGAPLKHDATTAV
jgi:hypothetical protein